jgi:outer membrane protein assembly factor BamA
VDAHGGSEDRIYFSRGAEIVHRVARGGLTLRVGRPLSGPFAIEGAIGARSADAEPNAEVYRDRDVEGISRGDLVPYDSLATTVRDDVGRRELAEVGLALVVDSRSGRGLAQRGVWGRTRLAGVFGDSTDFSRAEGDVRVYVPIFAQGQLALRARGGSVTREAPFYERYYAGGLYTVRGYPSQSLTPPGGDLCLVTGSIELRGALIGDAERPRLAAIAFLDVAATWSAGAPKGAGGLGYGVRVRVPWLGYVGLDVGLPLDDSILGEAFHVNGSLGWTF